MKLPAWTNGQFDEAGCDDPVKLCCWRFGKIYYFWKTGNCLRLLDQNVSEVQGYLLSTNTNIELIQGILFLSKSYCLNSAKLSKINKSLANAVDDLVLCKLIQT